MTWLILSLLTALAVASQDVWVKKFFSHLSAYDMAAYPMFYSFPMFSIAALCVPIPPLDATFFWYFVISLPLNAIPFLLYMKAIKISPLSLTVPYLAFTPVFMIGTGYIFLGEMPNIWGCVGIITTCAGCYVLNIDLENRSFTAPLKAVFKETGSWIMLIVSLFFSFCAVLGKKAILHSSPLFFTLSFFAVFNFCLLVFLLIFGKIRVQTFKTYPIKGCIAGCLLFFHALFHGLAITLTKAAYMISVKRLSVLFGIIYGGLIFKEKNIAIRFCGALFMLLGAVIITLGGG